MKTLSHSISKILKQKSFSQEDICILLSIHDPANYQLLQTKADQIQKQYFQDTLHYRGLIEFSNICIKDCLYCGIRKSNLDFDRYQMSLDEIMDCVKWNHENQYGSITLQAGERQDPEFIELVTTILQRSQKITQGKIGITLSCGEQTKETYEKWFEAGAHRYLLRIETSNSELYQKIHPQDGLHQFEKRVECLQNIRKIGYQLGTGVMIGLPHQTITDLANDILFFKRIGAHMIGMGPYIVHSSTPLAKIANNSVKDIQHRFQLGLNMIAVTRIVLKNVNIAATTALQALDPIGREKGVEAGANILMPITTTKKYRKDYQLYDNKPCIEDTSEQCKRCLMGRVSMVQRKVGFGEQGNSPSYKTEKGNYYDPFLERRNHSTELY